MPSFDAVSEVDLQEADNAVNITVKTVETRYDFRGSKTEITLNKKEKTINVVTEDDMKMRAVQDMLAGSLIKRGISPKAVEYGKVEATSHGMLKCEAKLKCGLDKELAKTVTKLIKESKLKVQAQIQDEQVRVTAVKIDDLQAVIQLLKEADLPVPLQFVNMKR
jgi:uncharacterized protein YajQ (UPF0234 family)